MNDAEAREYVRFRLRVKHGTMTGFAAYRGVSVAAVSKALKHAKEIPDWLLEAAGLEKQVSYTTKKGIND